MISTFHNQCRGEKDMDTLYLIIIAFVVVAAVLMVIWFISRQQRQRIEVVEEENVRSHRDEYIPFDEEAAEVLERRIVKCSECDEEVSPYDEECPNCGARLSMAVYECSNCSKEVDPRDKECPHCGEILLPDPYVCPNCMKPVEEDSTKCDYCGARYWSPILLDEKSLKKKTSRTQPVEEPEPEEERPSRPVRRRSYR